MAEEEVVVVEEEAQAEGEEVVAHPLQVAEAIIQQHSSLGCLQVVCHLSKRRERVQVVSHFTSTEDLGN